MSARISGVKNFVSIGDSFVRALPFNQVKSANANGSVAGVFAAPLFPFSVACGPSTATRSLESEFELASVGRGMILELAAVTAEVAVFAEGGCAADASVAGAAAGLPLDSRSATRFSSCSTRSRSHRSRSVNPGAGASGLIGAALEGVWAFPSSSAVKRPGATLLDKATARKIHRSCRFLPNQVISLSYTFFPSSTRELRARQLLRSAAFRELTSY